MRSGWSELTGGDAVPPALIIYKCPLAWAIPHTGALVRRLRPKGYLRRCSDRIRAPEPAHALGFGDNRRRPDQAPPEEPDDRHVNSYGIIQIHKQRTLSFAGRAGPSTPASDLRVGIRKLSSTPKARATVPSNYLPQDVNPGIFIWLFCASRIYRAAALQSSVMSGGGWGGEHPPPGHGDRGRSVAMVNYPRLLIISVISLILSAGVPVPVISGSSP